MVEKYTHLGTRGISLLFTSEVCHPVNLRMNFRPFYGIYLIDWDSDIVIAKLVHVAIFFFVERARFDLFLFFLHILDEFLEERKSWLSLWTISVKITRHSSAQVKILEYFLCQNFSILLVLFHCSTVYFMELPMHSYQQKS